MSYTQRDVMDATTRLRILIEGVKLGFIKDFNAANVQAADLLKIELARTGAASIGDLTKKDLNALKKRIALGQAEIYKKHTSALTKSLHKLIGVDFGLNARLWATIATGSPSPLSKAQAMAYLMKSAKKLTPLFGRAALSDIDALQARILSAPLAANGRTATQMLNGIMAGAQNQVEQRLTMAWSSKEALHETTQALTSFGESGLSSVSRKLVNQSATVIDTMLSHVHNSISAQVESALAEKYVYLSIIDSRTSDICLDLEGREFEYGKGPIPPMHPNCRSQTQALIVPGKPKKETYLAWLKRQPEEIQVQMIGSKNSGRLMSGELKVEELGKYKPMRPLTIEQLEEKFEQIFNR